MRWKRVIELGEQTIKRFDGKQLHDDEFSSCPNRWLEVTSPRIRCPKR